MEFVLADEIVSVRAKNHATCKRNYIESKGRILTVLAWRYIRNFQITPTGGAYRTTDHTWKMASIKIPSLRDLITLMMSCI
ncbi:unnamed protein product [Brassica oleracea var. botrytis]